MRVPTVPYRQADESEEPRVDPYLASVIGAGVLFSASVWALAIAKLIDLCAWR